MFPSSFPARAVSQSQEMVRLGSITPSVGAYIDFLSIFTSEYDNYLIVGNGIKFTADDGLQLRFAVEGSVPVSGSDYYDINVPGGQASPTNAAAVTSAASVRAAGMGCNFQISVLNVNDGIRMKTVESRATWNDVVGATNYFSSMKACAYHSSSVLSGFRLHSLFGANFAKGGSVTVYGYAK